MPVGGDGSSHWGLPDHLGGAGQEVDNWGGCAGLKPLETFQGHLLVGMEVGDLRWGEEEGGKAAVEAGAQYMASTLRDAAGLPLCPRAMPQEMVPYRDLPRAWRVLQACWCHKCSSPPQRAQL